MSAPARFPNSDVALDELQEIARVMRIDIIRMIAKAASGHPGTSLSAVDILLTLFLKVMRHDPQNLDWPERDHFILSKGHGVPALYAILAYCGYFDRQLLATLRQLDSPLQGHPVHGTVPGIEGCTGSLGQGLSIAQGLALSQRLDAHNAFTFCMLGDGENQEGQVWEAAMSAAKYKVDNLVAILDHNKAQIDGLVSEVMPLDPLEGKWTAFGWNVKRINGHDYAAIFEALKWSQKREGMPKLILADTIKGKGISFMESDLVKWHGIATSEKETSQALQELGTSMESAWP